jgi:hypothetical protein
MNVAVFWNVALCSLVDNDRRFRGAYCLNRKGAVSQKTAIFSYVLVYPRNLTISRKVLHII